jgi:hypothetical protein
MGLQLRDMKPIILCFATAILTTGPSVCQPPADVKGWGKIEWGMTVQEAKTAYGSQAETSTVVPGPSFTAIDRLTIPRINIGDAKATASIQTKRESDKVSSVAIQVGDEADTPTVRSGNFDDTKKLLIEKYGQPKTEDRKPDSGYMRSTVVWTFPSTSITLLLVESQRFDIGYVSISYEAVDKKALDAL